MKRESILIFAGTSEGRRLAEILSEKEIPAVVCVATEYGQEQIGALPGVGVRVGRLDAGQMRELIAELSPAAVVDATHPYAELVSANIRTACEAEKVRCIRLLRESSGGDQMEDAVVFDDCGTAAEWLNGREGNILLTTGMKELPVFAEAIADKTRIYARVLLQETVISETGRLGLSKKQMICMQGPFTREMNAATIRQVGAKYLVTKESGAAGGFAQKAEAARETGAVCVVIRRPDEEAGCSLEEVVDLLERQICGSGLPEAEVCGKPAPQTVTLLGIGMGDAGTMTQEAVRACESADCIIGAERMTEALRRFRKPEVSMYRSEEIAAYIREHPQYEKIVVALSGDVGFYSGAKKLAQALGGMDVRLVCGISSVAYFAAKLKTSWEDMVLVSSHGRDQNLTGAVKANRRVFTLASKAESIREIAKTLTDCGLGAASMTVGADLSYPTESVQSGTAADFADYDGPGICVALIENPDADRYVVTPGIPDEAFLRGKVPMTKEEVRAVALSKLALTREAVVYDVGAGTGSVSVECARMAARGTVYAIERKGEAASLLRENRLRFGVSNLQIVEGCAPEALQDLPAPTHVFVGGSGGNLREIIALCLEKNPGARFVIDCIALETVSEAMRVLEKLGPEDADVCCISVSKAKEIGSYHLMTGQNPVYIISFTGKKG